MENTNPIAAGIIARPEASGPEASIPAAANTAEARRPLHAQLLNGSVVNLRAAADEEQHAFLLGRFKRLGNANARGPWRGDLLNAQNEIIAHRIFRISSSGIERLFCNLGNPHLAIIHSPDADNRDDMLAIIDGVVEQMLDAADHVGHSKALAQSFHAYLPVGVPTVFESQQSAMSALQGVLSAPSDEATAAQ